MKIQLITGISGSGKSVALKVFEDAGYDCIDNLPVFLLENLVLGMEKLGQERIAIAIDARRGDSITQLPLQLKKLSQQHQVDVLFLKSDTATLVQRFSETRRRHPLSNPQESSTLIDVIERERNLMEPLAIQAHQIDTSNLPAHTLRHWIQILLKEKAIGLSIIFESFAFKKGVPSEADMVFDARCLPNPHYIDTLRPFNGKDLVIQEFLEKSQGPKEMLEDITSYLRKWIPRYLKDGRSYLTVAIGCTGGQHRSVYLVHQLKKRFSEEYGSDTQIHFLERHRELDSALPT